MSAAVQTPAPAVPSPATSATYKRITSVPVVADSLSFAQSTINAYPLLSRTYKFGEGAFNTSLKVAQPVTTRLQPQLAFADSWAVKGLDFAESKFPYPFKASSDEIVSRARAPADHAVSLVNAYTGAVHKAYSERIVAPAKSLYDSRVAPAASSAQAQFEQLKSQNAYLARATDIVTNLQQNLSKTLETISARGKQEGDQAARRAQGLSNAIFAELDRVRGFALSLPAESRKRVAPVIDLFSESYETLSKEARDTSVPITTRLSNVVKHVQSQTLPALQKAIVNPPAEAPKANGK